MKEAEGSRGGGGPVAEGGGDVVSFDATSTPTAVMEGLDVVFAAATLFSPLRWPIGVAEVLGGWLPLSRRFLSPSSCKVSDGVRSGGHASEWGRMCSERRFRPAGECGTTVGGVVDGVVADPAAAGGGTPEKEEEVEEEEEESGARRDVEELVSVHPPPPLPAFTLFSPVRWRDLEAFVTPALIVSFSTVTSALPPPTVVVPPAEEEGRSVVDREEGVEEEGRAVPRERAEE